MFCNCFMILCDLNWIVLQRQTVSCLRACRLTMRPCRLTETVQVGCVTVQANLCGLLVGFLCS